MRACSTHEDIRPIQNFNCKNLKKRDHFHDISIEGSIVSNVVCLAKYYPNRLSPFHDA
jgi:hypothetical protein